MAEQHELRLECGCHFQDYGMGLALQWCPMHEAAPDLLAACEILLAELGVGNWPQAGDYHEAIAIGRAALAKARGE